MQFQITKYIYVYSVRIRALNLASQTFALEFTLQEDAKLLTLMG